MSLNVVDWDQSRQTTQNVSAIMLFAVALGLFYPVKSVATVTGTVTETVIKTTETSEPSEATESF